MSMTPMADSCRLRSALSERTHTHPGSGVSYVYALPFRIRDRESDFRRIHATLLKEV